MPGKIRVYELARELQCTSADVLIECKRLGEFIKGDATPLEPQVARRLRAALQRGQSTPTESLSRSDMLSEAACRRAEDAVRAFLERAPQPATRLARPPMAEKRDDRFPVFLEPRLVAAKPAYALPPRSAQTNRDRPHRPKQGPSPQRPPTAPIEDLALELARGEARVAPTYVQYLLEWLARGFGIEDVRWWCRAGLSVDDWVIADICAQAGLLPEDLTIKDNGRRVLSRLRAGEPVASVMSRLVRQRQAG